MDPALLLQIGVILLGGIMGILNGSMVAVANDTLATRFHSSLSTVGWVSSGYLLAVIVAIPIAAWAVDRFGGKSMWLFGLILFLAGSVACGLAWNVGSLIVFRVIQGLGGGTLDPLVLILLVRAAGTRRTGRVMGLMGLVLSLGPVLGPVVGGTILDGLGWRWMFFINLPIVVIAFLLALPALPVDPSRARGPQARLDVVGLTLLGPGVAVLVLALSQAAGRAAFASWEVLTPLAVGVVLLAGYAIHTLGVRSTPPLIDPRLFIHRSFAASVTVMALVGLATFSLFFVLPLYYQQMHGYGASAAGLLVAPLGLGGAVAMPLSGRLSDRLGSRSLALAGGLVAVLSAVAFTQIGARTNEVLPALAALTSGLGLGFVGAPTMGSLYRTLPTPLVAQGSSVLYMLNQLGASLGIAVSALIVERDGRGDAIQGFHGAYWWVAGAILVALITSVLLPGRPAAAADAEPAGIPTDVVVQGNSR